MRMISSWWWHRLFLILLPFTKKQLTTIHGQDTAERTVEHGLVAEAPPYIAETKTECIRSLRGMVTFWPHSPPSGLGAASPTEPREGKPTFSPTYCWITLPEHTEICVAHPTALLTMTLEQRKYTARGFLCLQSKTSGLTWSGYSVHILVVWFKSPTMSHAGSGSCLAAPSG